MANKSFTSTQFIDKANIIHDNKYNYNKTEFVSSREKLIITCPIHGDFIQRASAHINGQGCKQCRNILVGKRFAHTPEQFIADCNKLHKNKYDYSKSLYINDKTKIIIICPIHGEFSQTPSCHKKGTGCERCGVIQRGIDLRINKEKFIQRAIELHGDCFDYSNSQCTNSHDYVIIKCNNCLKEFKQLAYSHINIGNGCPNCLSSKREFELKDFIKNELKLNIIENSRSIIPPKEIDIYIPEKQFAIEYNGTYHHSELMGTDKHYHINKTIECENNNIRLLHIFENEWKLKKDIVKSIIRNKLGKTECRFYARKCEIREIRTKDKNAFLDLNHIQGKDQSRIKIGLYYMDVLVSVMTFGIPRYNPNMQWELIRFANIMNANIVGGASKLLNYFIKTYNPSSIISYADRRYSDGNLYEKLNFKLHNISSPRYWYMKKSNYLHLYHRSNFTKERIKKEYPELDFNKTEWELMIELGYNRIWDCGTKVYVWSNT